jgi:hypothetical protein
MLSFLKWFFQEGDYAHILRGPAVHPTGPPLRNARSGREPTKTGAPATMER